jgi:hypothetical protein
MENHLTLIDKKTKMIKQIILVESYDDISDWGNADTLAIPDPDHLAILYGSWDGEDFIAPTNERLIELGLLKPVENESEAETL